MSKITLESLTNNIYDKSTDNILLKSINNFSVNNFLFESFGFNDIVSYKISKLTAEQQEILTESISISNLDKASLIMDNSNDELMKDIRECQGNISRMKFYNVIKQMLKDLELAYKNNPEVNKSAQILHELESNSSTYISAFRTNNTFKKVVFYSSAISAIYTIVKEHAQTIDFTSSHNENKIVMIDNPHHINNKNSNDNITNLNNNLKLLAQKPTFGHKLSENEDYNKTMGALLEFDLFGGISSLWGSAKDATSNAIDSSIENIGSGLVKGAAKGAKSVASDVTSNPLVQFAGNTLITAGTIALIALTSLFVLYIIKRTSAKPIIQYIKSYEHILDASKKSNTRGDKNITNLIEGMKKIKTWLQKIFKNENSRNIQEYMKDLQKDNDIIKKYTMDRKENNVQHTTNDFF